MNSSPPIVSFLLSNYLLISLLVKLAATNKLDPNTAKVIGSESGFVDKKAPILPA